jgi:hypothetical protein
MNKILISALATLALAAGCSSSSHPVAQATATKAVTAAPSSLLPSPSPSPSSTARLTMRQAARAYARIVDPANRLLNAAGQDITDAVPLAQFHADLRAAIAAFRVMSARLAAVRWPDRVAPYITAMLGTDVVAHIRCAQDLLKARNYSQANNISFNQDCTQAQNTSNAGTIRSLLHLPSPG